MTHRNMVALAASMIALALASGASAARPPRPFSDDASSVLDLIAWLGSLPDLARVNTVTGGLGLQPRPDPTYIRRGGHRIANFTTMLKGARPTPGSTVQITYTVLHPGGMAAPRHGGGWTRADVRLSLFRARIEDQNLITEGSVCVRLAEMKQRFGPPAHIELVTDGGGSFYAWRVGTAGRWQTYAGANFGNDDTRCADQVTLWQQTGPGVGMW